MPRKLVMACSSHYLLYKILHFARARTQEKITVMILRILGPEKPAAT